MSDQSCEIAAYNPPPEDVEAILQKYRIVAVVGLSPKPERASHQVAKYMKENGYSIVPVNPGQKNILGEKCYPGLKAIPFRVDIVDVFRKPDAVPPIVDDAIEIGAMVVWMQLGIVNNAAAEKAREAGLEVVMDRCMKVEHMRMVK
jgi:predicted CoA-binding protein